MRVYFFLNVMAKPSATLPFHSPTEGGLSQIKELCHALYRNSEPGKLMMYSLKYSQIESGLRFHLLEDPTVFISWLTPTWIMSLRAFLFNHNITITL
jgi:hypothetical protein